VTRTVRVRCGITSGTSHDLTWQSPKNPPHPGLLNCALGGLVRSHEHADTIEWIGHQADGFVASQGAALRHRSARTDRASASSPTRAHTDVPICAAWVWERVSVRCARSVSGREHTTAIAGELHIRSDHRRMGDTSRRMPVSEGTCVLPQGLRDR